MIAKNISFSEKFADLANEASRTLYLMLIPHTDDYGRFDAGPRTFRATICPLLDYSIKEIGDFIEDLEEVGLIETYEVNGQKYGEVVGFDRFQTFRSDKDRISLYPAPDGEEPDFTCEKQMENWLEDNLENFESGLVLTKRQYCMEKPGRTGTKRFARVDILARDTNSADVLIEVKWSQVRDFTITQQVAEYRKLYGKPCRCVVVGRTFSKSAISAAKDNNVELWNIYDGLKTDLGQSQDRYNLTKEKLREDKSRESKETEAGKEEARAGEERPVAPEGALRPSACSKPDERSEKVQDLFLKRAQGTISDEDFQRELAELEATA